MLCSHSHLAFGLIVSGSSPGTCVNRMEENCEICGKEIDVCKTALKLCDDCFEEKCECGHKRAMHVDNDGSCIPKRC